jgi:Ca2+-binding EF-hand superfamily protein
VGLPSPVDRTTVGVRGFCFTFLLPHEEDDEMKTGCVCSFALFLALGISGFGTAQEQSQTNQQTQRRPLMRCQERFDAMDTNRDGVVTMEEFLAVRHRGGRAEEIFKARDSNGDGQLSKEEFCAARGKGAGRAKGATP